MIRVHILSKIFLLCALGLNLNSMASESSGGCENVSANEAKTWTLASSKLNCLSTYSSIMKAEKFAIAFKNKFCSRYKTPTNNYPYIKGWQWNSNAIKKTDTDHSTFEEAHDSINKTCRRIACAFDLRDAKTKCNTCIHNKTATCISSNKAKPDPKNHDESHLQKIEEENRSIEEACKKGTFSRDINSTIPGIGTCANECNLVKGLTAEQRQLLLFDGDNGDENSNRPNYNEVKSALVPIMEKILKDLQSPNGNGNGQSSDQSSSEE